MAKDFTFKQFHINAFECGMPVSTDGVLLGAWANIQESHSILDIGCGTGLLSIMSAQRNMVAIITGVEIEKNAYQAAIQNCKSSPWSKRLKITHTAIKEFTKQSLNNNQTFESIICNPPYFNDGEQTQNKQRAIARHTSTLSHSDLLAYCEKLLENKGRAHFVLPNNEGKAFIERLNSPIAGVSETKLKLMRLTEVKTTINKPVSRILIELIKQEQQPDIEHEQLIISGSEGYSDQFVSLTKDFYLKM